MSCTTILNLVRFYSGSLEQSLECNLVLGATVTAPALDVWVYLKYFALTFLLEAPFYLLGFRYLLKWNKKLAGLLLTILLLNLATHPLVCFGIPALGESLNWDYADYLSIAETFAPLVEGVLLFVITRKTFLLCLGLAIITNLFSWNVGTMLFN